MTPSQHLVAAAVIIDSATAAAAVIIVCPACFFSFSQEVYVQYIRLGSICDAQFEGKFSVTPVDKFTNFMVGRNPLVIERLLPHSKPMRRKGPHFSPSKFCSITIRFHLDSTSRAQ
jgi:hypothetical protein